MIARPTCSDPSTAGQGPDWARLREVGIPQGPLTFVHGDLWPGNLLFRDDRLTGIVDWG